ncbi:SIMPL domain-containing protein [Candidatus Pacearchaeota archaeon]|nr:SIMPL domain-containing protein [Candidatus Pacearchaeota archaeon]
MKKISDSVLITLIIVSGIVLVSLIGILYMNSTGLSNTISSNGFASIKVMPDLVSVYFTVQTYGETSSEASSKNADIVTSMKNIFETEGYEKDEIKTQSFSIYPEYDYSGSTPKVTRYVAYHLIKIEVSAEDKSKIGRVIDAGVNAGAGISYINFELSQGNENFYKAEAIKMATQDAKAKAEALAEGSGNELGNLVSISTSDFYYQPWQVFVSETGRDVGAAKESTSITPTDQEVTASVTAVFRMK